MKIFENNLLSQPANNQILWRYIKEERIDDFLNGDFYFSKLTQFDDYYEGIKPLHLILLNYIKRVDPWNYELDESIQRLAENDNYGNRIRLYTDNFLAEYEDKLLFSNLAQLLGEEDQEKLKTILNEKISSFSSILDSHREDQQKTLVSCWFLGDAIESALMWNSYSEQGGIAVYIPFEHFKRYCSTFFELSSKYNVLNNITKVTAGLVKYHHYYLTNEWLEEIKKGIPLAFFKHISYKNENEYRIIMETDDINAEQKHGLFPLIDHFQIILHPSATNKDMEEMRKRVNKRVHVKFSELSHTIK